MQKGRRELQKKQKVENLKVEGPQQVAEVFSLARDTENLHPYHLDGDMDMYSEEKLAVREQLLNDADLVKQINEIVKLYQWNEQEELGFIIGEKEYKQKQAILATILRPDIDKEELEFVVDSDWQHDKLTKDGKHYLTKEKLVEALYELVDVWTVGATKEEYISFTRLLRKKLDRGLKTLK